MTALLLLAAALVQQDDVQKWIRELGDDSIEVRETASRRLRDRGESILARLEKARTASSSAEVQARLSAIMAGIGKDAEFAKVFGPTKRLTLTGKDRKLGELLKTLADAGSITIACKPLDPEKRIAIDAVNVTWWEALDRTVQAASASYGVEHAEDFHTTEIQLKAGLSRPFPCVYQDQFRIGVIEVKRLDHVAPGKRESAVVAVIEALHQPNLKPSHQSWKEPIVVKSLKDAKGVDPRLKRPDWAGGMFLAGRQLSFTVDLWVASDAAFPLTLEGEVDMPFAKGSQEVTMKFGADEPPTKIGAVTLKIKELTQSKTGTRFELEATTDEESSNLGSSFVQGSLVLVDSKGVKHDKYGDGRSATEGESTWDFTFTGDVAEPKQIVFRWVGEYHRIAIPFRLEGIQLPK